MTLMKQFTIREPHVWILIACAAVVVVISVYGAFSVSYAQPEPGESVEENISSDPVQELLQQADAYLEQQELAAAYDLYLRVLGVDPANQHAREKIFEIISTYKAQLEEAQQQDETEYTKLTYQKYRNSVRDFLQILTTQLKRWIREYGELVAVQKTGEDVTLDIVPALNTIIQILEDLKVIYQDFPQTEEDAVNSQKMVDRINQTINTYKQELLVYQ